MGDYHESLRRWQEACGAEGADGRLGFCTEPVTGGRVDLTFTSYVDDVAKQHVTRGPAVALAAVACARGVLLQERLAERGYAQNVDKTVTCPALRGPGAHLALRALAGGASPGLGGVKPRSRYLGAQLGAEDAVHAE
eukprot:8851073-Lingulodinium_polyedra.AAC.1